MSKAVQFAVTMKRASGTPKTPTLTTGNLTHGQIGIDIDKNRAIYYVYADEGVVELNVDVNGYMSFYQEVDSGTAIQEILPKGSSITITAYA